MRTADFDYRLPPELIAQTAVARGRSRMLVLDRATGAVAHRTVRDVPGLLRPDDLLLANDTRVLAARLVARRLTGRRFELLLLRPEDGAGCWEALLRPSGRVRPGERLLLEDGGGARPRECLGDGRWRVDFEPALDVERIDRLGETPLPPYIERTGGATAEDRERYQTVYAAVPGAVAAPTAGLHFSAELLDEVRRRGVEIVYVTLHVGLGTFRPVSVERVEEHKMHAEWYRFGEDAAARVNGALDDGRRVVCVGTTSVRALEGALTVGNGRVQPGAAETDLFITPGYRFHGVGALLTNFHLPRSSLLMLVSALAGRERVLAAYQEAIAERYRFYSYGDAMLVL